MPQVEKWFEKAGVDPLKFFGDNRTGHKGIIPLEHIVEERPEKLKLHFVYRCIVFLDLLRVSLDIAVSSLLAVPTLTWLPPPSIFLFRLADAFAGMFIYPATMLRYLRQTYTYEDFSTVLASVPQDINSLYRASLVRLQKS